MKLTVKAIVSRADRILKRNSYHKKHKANAFKALESIERQKGKLPNDIRLLCDKYAVEHLGHKKYAPWLYVYAAVQGDFKKGWIPDNYYGEVIAGKFDGEFSKLSNLKALSNKLLNTKMLPDLIYHNNGTFLSVDNFRVIPSRKVPDILFGENDKVIFKGNDSSQGRGVYFCSRKEWDTNDQFLTNGVFQRVIKQHAFFDELFPYPGATIRITTVRDFDGNITTRAAYLRLGRSNDDSLSKHVQSSNHIRIAVHFETGALYPNGYMADWTSVDAHPDTNVPFKDLKIPSFHKACRQAEELHGNLPFVQCIGWDLTINTDENVEIMEWNTGHNDIKFSEAIHGPNFTDLLSYATNRPL